MDGLMDGVVGLVRENSARHLVQRPNNPSSQPDVLQSRQLPLQTQRRPRPPALTQRRNNLHTNALADLTSLPSHLSTRFPPHPSACLICSCMLIFRPNDVSS